MIKNLLEDCLRLEKRKVRFLSVVLALSLLLNLLLSVLLGVTLSYKASEVKRQTSATASAAVVRCNCKQCTTRRDNVCHNILTQNIRCKIYPKKNLRNLLTDLCSAKLKKPYYMIFMLKNCLCGKLATNTVIPKVVSEKFILGC